MRALWALPQWITAATRPSTAAAAADTEIINLVEDTHRLERLLRMICSLEISTLSTLDLCDPVEPVLYAAEKGTTCRAQS
jgi:hypothetical protein